MKPDQPLADWQLRVVVLAVIERAIKDIRSENFLENIYSEEALSWLGGPSMVWIELVGHDRCTLQLLVEELEELNNARNKVWQVADIDTTYLAVDETARRSGVGTDT